MARVALIKQAAEITGLSYWELSTGAKSGKYPAFRIGSSRGRWAFDLDLLQQRIRELMMQNIEAGAPAVGEYGKIRRIKA